MSEFAGRISRPRPERAGVCDATRLATRLPNGLPPAAENDYALSFNGVDQWVDCGTGIGNTLGDNYAGSLTVSLWFKTDITSGDDGLFEIGALAGAHGEISIALYSNTLRVKLNGGGWTRSMAFTDQDNWNHVVAIYKGGSEASSKMYLNGSEATTTTSWQFSRKCPTWTLLV